MNKPLYIFDLDGTLSDTSHRQKHLDKTPKDWDAFYDACAYDDPIPAVILTLNALAAMGCEIWIWTGRSDTTSVATRHWLNEHRVAAGKVTMRPAGDHRTDVVLKREWLDGMRKDDRKRLVAVFEDRNRMAAMYREAGVACFQVKDGDF